MSISRNPAQPLYLDKFNALRFKQNDIIALLVSHASRTGLDLNKIAVMSFSDDDRSQFIQLLGSSLDGYLEHDCADKETAYLAEQAFKNQTSFDPQKEVAEYYKEKYERLKGLLKPVIAQAFDIHPDDLDGE